MSSRRAILRQGRGVAPGRGPGGGATVPASRIRGSAVLRSRRIATEQEIIRGAERRAREIEAAAAADGAALRAEAEAERGSIRERAQEEGYAEGYAAGQAAAQQEMSEALQLVRAVAADTKVLRDTVLADTEPQILRLTAAAARRVVGGVVAQQPELVEEAVRRALALAGDQRVLRLRVHPESLQLLSARFGPEAEGEAGEDWELRGDEGLALGGCIVETSAGVIDASVEGQTDEMVSAWQELV